MLSTLLLPTCLKDYFYTGIKGSPQLKNNQTER